MIQKIKVILGSDMMIKKIVAYALLILFFYFLKDFLFLFLLTFLFAYLSYSLAKFLSIKIKKLFKKETKITKILTSISFLSTILYILYIVGFSFFLTHLIPTLLSELNNLSRHVPIIAEQVKNITTYLNEIQHTKNTVSADMSALMNEKNIEIVKNTIKHLKLLWSEVVKFLLSFILSYFFIIDRKRLSKYLEWIKNSSLKFLYEEYAFLFKKIAKWFLLIFRAQSKIAIANTILTYLWLHIIGFIIWQSIPYLGLLTVIVFLFSFVPVLWVIISSVPIALIVYNIAGFMWVVYVVVMILFIHAIETYILNPRFVSEEVELPISLTFLILLVWEHIFGPIWLIVSVPIFYIMVEVIREIDGRIKNNASKFSWKNIS